jgi:hypothetical protein
MSAGGHPMTAAKHWDFVTAVIARHQRQLGLAELKWQLTAL